MSRVWRTARPFAPDSAKPPGGRSAWFRFFDPAPWGGQWMKTVCGLDPEPENYGWCFDCVPEENSLLLQFGETVMELPVHQCGVP